MRPPIEFLFPPELGTELIYSFVIIVCSLMIYYSTKEMYELSSYRGIRYFRLAFLFFAIAYFFRYFVIFLLMIFKLDKILFFSPRIIFVLSVMIFLYFSGMAVFALLHSVMWKSWGDSKAALIFFNIISICFSFSTIFFGNRELSLLVSIVFFVFTTITLIFAYLESRKKEKSKSLIKIYFMLFVFFFLNIVEVMLPKFLSMYNILVYLISISLFMAISYKVIKKTGN